MTRKDFELIAHIIRNLPNAYMTQYPSNSPHFNRLKLSEQFARALKADNPRFDTARFCLACSTRSEEVQ